MINPEQRKDDSGDQPGGLGQLLSDCAFVVFRPDQGVASLEAALQEETLEEGYMTREFRVEGRLVRIMADLPDSEHGYLTEITVTGMPERGVSEDWFVRQTKYRISKRLEITQSVEDEYGLVDYILLPEYYTDEIKEEADAQRKRRCSERQMLEQYDSMEYLRRFILPRVQNDRFRKELGLDQVGDQEIAELTALIGKIRTNPDLYEFVREETK